MSKKAGYNCIWRALIDLSVMIPEGPRTYSRGTEESRAERKALREGLRTRPHLMFSLGPFLLTGWLFYRGRNTGKSLGYKLEPRIYSKLFTDSLPDSAVSYQLNSCMSSVKWAEKQHILASQRWFPNRQTPCQSNYEFYQCFVRRTISCFFQIIFRGFQVVVFCLLV